ncbi:hypothetical protein M408DRAFT_24098 [Serendipita vermifera MAFF 305830]|uniref:CLASP N-terminal domain-containing protein n=1 Tax=Serendipita vermifera MAFF 305830 TaxID=933852 RepID=A0A0C2XG83_SERVB|nr:hypothetical protein M408DRAFT_24098 [Serendipita vermifera MAFF 305830]
MSEPTPTTALTVHDQTKMLQENIKSTIPALARTLDKYDYYTIEARFHAMRALAKLAENPTFCQEIASTALASVSRVLDFGRSAQR